MSKDLGSRNGFVHERIDMSEMTSGVSFMQIVTDGGVFTKKLVLTK